MTDTLLSILRQEEHWQPHRYNQEHTDFKEDGTGEVRKYSGTVDAES